MTITRKKRLEEAGKARLATCMAVSEDELFAVGRGEATAHLSVTVLIQA